MTCACCLSCIGPGDESINPKHVASATDRDCKLCSTDVLHFPPTDV